MLPRVAISFAQSYRRRSPDADEFSDDSEIAVIGTRMHDWIRPIHHQISVEPTQLLAGSRRPLVALAVLESQRRTSDGSVLDESTTAREAGSRSRGS